MFWAVMLTGKAHKVFAQVKAMAKRHPRRTIGQITTNIKNWKRNHNLEEGKK